MTTEVRDEGGVLTAPHVLEYPYRRSVGPVLGRFFTALRDGKLLGVKTKAGKVLAPPAEYDPETGAAVTDQFVPIGPVIPPTKGFAGRSASVTAVVKVSGRVSVMFSDPTALTKLGAVLTSLTISVKVRVALAPSWSVTRTVAV